MVALAPPRADRAGTAPAAAWAVTVAWAATRVGAAALPEARTPPAGRVARVRAAPRRSHHHSTRVRCRTNPSAMKRVPCVDTEATAALATPTPAAGTNRFGSALVRNPTVRRARDRREAPAERRACRARSATRPAFGFRSALRGCGPHAIRSAARDLTVRPRRCIPSAASPCRETSARGIRALRCDRSRTRRENCTCRQRVGARHSRAREHAWRPR